MQSLKLSSLTCAKSAKEASRNCQSHSSTDMLVLRLSRTTNLSWSRKNVCNLYICVTRFLSPLFAPSLAAAVCCCSIFSLDCVSTLDDDGNENQEMWKRQNTTRRERERRARKRRNTNFSSAHGGVGWMAPRHIDSVDAPQPRDR